MSKYTTTDLYARLLAKEMTHYAAKREGILDKTKKGVEIPPAWQELIKENDEIFQKLKAEKTYFREDGSSIFTDFKRFTRNVVSDEEKVNTASRFSSRMSKDDFLREARKVVEEWQTASGIEKNIKSRREAI